MKKIFLSAAVLFTAILSNAQFTSAKLTAAGLTCAMCTKAIYNALEKVPSVSKIDTDIKNSSFVISFKNGADVDADALGNAVEEAGFSVVKLSLTGNFNNVPVSDNAHVIMYGKTYHFVKVNINTLNGEQTLNMIDKKFISAKEFKKYETGKGQPCLESGKAEACCPQSLAAAKSRIYNVTL
ncbi:MAG: heavy-metal-associated domain-containing protein [Chitinophagaceae bacterium]|nr:heavy-metal-associated domain-containing protein [Chitinophagaceae bacterium]